MERLTKLKGNYVCWNGNQDYSTRDRYAKVLDRLAAYEDSGLTPEEVKQLIVSDESKEQSSIEWFNRAKELQDKLNSYKQAEAEGRLVVLPCLPYSTRLTL